MVCSSFMKDSVEYLGHRVDANGIHTTPEKIAAIINAPLPQNLQQLRSFLGLLNYYRKIFTKFSSHSLAIERVTSKQEKMDLVFKVYPSCTSSQAITHCFQHLDPLRSYLTSKASGGCIPVWVGSRHITCATWR